MDRKQSNWILILDNLREQGKQKNNLKHLLTLNQYLQLTNKQMGKTLTLVQKKMNTYDHALILNI